MRFPDPPALTKDAPPRGSAELAAQLAAEGLLKADWDSTKHPRVGAPPNPGWFATTDTPSPSAPREAEAANTETDAGSRAASLDAPTDAAVANPELAADADSGRRLLSWTWRDVLNVVRTSMVDAGRSAVRTGRFVLWSDPALKVAIETAIELLSSTPVNPDEQRAIDRTNASFDPPETLNELRQRPIRFRLGYERHHIVEQNPANLAKSPLDEFVAKFGRAALEDPRNIVWIPRTKHELITGYFNGEDPDDPAGWIRRRVVSEMDFDDQFEAGLSAMRLLGVLQ